MRTRRLFIPVAAFLLCCAAISCIDRDTIAGTGKEDPDAMISAGGGGQSGVVNYLLPVPVKVRILAANGRPVRGVIVEFSVENSNASFSDTTAVSDGNGYAQTSVTLGSKSDSVRIYATVLGLKGSPVKFTMFAASSGAAKVVLNDGNDQKGTVKVTFSKPVQVTVYDAFQNTVAGVPVYFTTANGTFSPANTLTDSAGRARSYWTPDSLVGTKSAQIVIPSIPSGTIPLTATVNSLLVPASFTRASSDTFYMLQGGRVNGLLAVKVQDKYGNPLYPVPANGFGVSFSVVAGEGTVTPATSSPSTNGIATAGVELSPTDTLLIAKASVGNSFLPIYFTIFGYVSIQIDSLSSAGGTATVYWQKNVNPKFKNYTLQRCPNYSFDAASTVTVAVVTDENTVSFTDPAPPAGTKPVYRLTVNYTNGFSFITNIRDVQVNP